MQWIHAGTVCAGDPCNFVLFGHARLSIFTLQLFPKGACKKQYQQLIKKLNRGDILVIKSIDRLGRNYEEILEQWRILCNVKHVDIEVVEFPLLNTNQAKQGLMGLFIANITLQILAYLAQTEREFIKQRQAEGIALAKAKGTQFGAERIKTPDGFLSYYRLWKSGTLTSRQAADKSGMSHSTFYRRCRELDAVSATKTR